MSHNNPPLGSPPPEWEGAINDACHTINNRVELNLTMSSFYPTQKSQIDKMTWNRMNRIIRKTPLTSAYLRGTVGKYFWVVYKEKQR